MTSPNTNYTTNLFKKRYGKLNELIPEGYWLIDNLSFQQGLKVGESFAEAFTLTNETGITLIGQDQTVATINPAIAGVVKQCLIKPSQIVMRSALPFGFISRASDANDERAFFNSTKYVMQNHIESHTRFLDSFMWYGQAAALMGYVTYAPTGTQYRGATYSASGNVQLTRADGTTITFTAGVNTAERAILFQPGQFAAGLFVGIEGAVIKQIASATGAVAASGKLTGVDADLGIIYVDFVPVAATSIGSHKIGFDGQEFQRELVGVNRILTNTGTLFDLNAAQYSLLRANVLDLGGKRFDIKALEVGVAMATNRGGLKKPLKIVLNPRTFAKMVDDEASLRKYDAKYSPGEASNGFESIKWYAANGVNEIIPCRTVKEGEAYGLNLTEWIRSGSAEISFQVPGMDREMIFRSIDQTAWLVDSYSDNFVLCRAPCRQILWTGLNDEGNAY